MTLWTSAPADTSEPRARTLRDALESGGTQSAYISRSTIAHMRCRACDGSGENLHDERETTTMVRERCAYLTNDNHINVRIQRRRLNTSLSASAAIRG